MNNKESLVLISVFLVFGVITLGNSTGFFTEDVSSEKLFTVEKFDTREEWNEGTFFLTTVEEEELTLLDGRDSGRYTSHSIEENRDTVWREVLVDYNLPFGTSATIHIPVFSSTGEVQGYERLDVGDGIKLTGNDEDGREIHKLEGSGHKQFRGKDALIRVELNSYGDQNPKINSVIIHGTVLNV